VILKVGLLHFQSPFHFNVLSKLQQQNYSDNRSLPIASLRWSWRAPAVAIVADRSTLSSWRIFHALLQCAVEHNRVDLSIS